MLVVGTPFGFQETVTARVISALHWMLRGISRQLIEAVTRQT